VGGCGSGWIGSSGVSGPLGSGCGAGEGDGSGCWGGLGAGTSATVGFTFGSVFSGTEPPYPNDRRPQQ
jgi:hypothetical protein